MMHPLLGSINVLTLQSPPFPYMLFLSLVGTSTLMLHGSFPTILLPIATVSSLTNLSIITISSSPIHYFRSPPKSLGLTVHLTSTFHRLTSSCAVGETVSYINSQAYSSSDPIGSDHRIVCAKIRLSLRCTKTAARPRLNWSAMTSDKSLSSAIEGPYYTRVVLASSR